MTIGEKIKKLRSEKFLTQSELAGEQITRNMLSLIEKGKAVPSLQTLMYLAEKLKVSPGFLLADEEESVFFLKAGKMAEIRLAYEKKNYRICLDLCERLIASSGADDELNLLAAECSLGTAKEEFFSDRVREACVRFDDAVRYAAGTAYYTGHIKTTAELYFRYLEELSPSFISENIDTEDRNLSGFIPLEDGFCRYIMALGAIVQKDDGMINRYLEQVPDRDVLLARHIRALQYMNHGEYEMAANCLNDILRSDETVPGTVLYYVFGNLEECCRKLENRKNAKMFAEARVSQFERLLSQ